MRIEVLYLLLSATRPGVRRIPVAIGYVTARGPAH
jgi:hypothetical protein